VSSNPCLSLAISRLTQAGPEHFAIWVLKAPYPGGYVHDDCIWSSALTQKWLAWQEMFSLQSELHVPLIEFTPSSVPSTNSALDFSVPSPGIGYGGRLMQDLGVSLWKWLFEGSIRNSLAESRGIATGQNKPLRLRMEIRDPHLIPLPWEIMQPEAGKQAISLNQQLLFSRTTSDVDPLCFHRAQDNLRILLVLGQDLREVSWFKPSLELQKGLKPDTTGGLQLQQEANALATVIEQGALSEHQGLSFGGAVPARVDTLVQPTPQQLITALDTGIYNIFFYAGHGIPAPDGGMLFLGENATLNGTELAQILVRNRVTLALFNACWGAQPDQQGQQIIERSSLAEVLIHHGVPAVLGMRDSIADQEALSFIQAFTKAICQRMPIDQAVAVARQQLLTLYKFNQPAWTLPILYMHPEFEGELLKSLDEGITELPVMPTNPITKKPLSVAYLRLTEEQNKVWRIRSGLMKVGRHQENDLVIQERWVSQKHAEIICREVSSELSEHHYFIRDFSRFGTLICGTKGWQKIHHQEVLLESGMQLKFGSTYGQTLEFVIEN
jgi:CHAT domain/FHA domain